MKKVRMWDVKIGSQFRERGQGLIGDYLSHCFNVKFDPSMGLRQFINVFSKALVYLFNRNVIIQCISIFNLTFVL